MTTTEQTPPAVLLPLGTWRLDPVHSTVAFEVRDMTHLLATIHGRFTDFDGALDVTSAGASASGAIRVASITTDHAERDENLRSSQFLDVVRSPEIRFESEAIEVVERRIRIAGRLELKGTATPVELDGELLGTGTDHSGSQRLAIAAEGVLPFGPMQVRLLIDVSAVKASGPITTTTTREASVS